MNTNKQTTPGGADQLRPAVTTVTATLPPMTLAQWYRLPAAVRYFIPWERARRALVIDPRTKRAIDLEMGPGIKLQPSRKVPS